MIVFLNGRFIADDLANCSVFDRGFLYGDGLFETIRVYNGVPLRWNQQLERLRKGAEFLKLRLPFSPKELRRALAKLVEKNETLEGVLRLTLSRGVGPRGYSIKKTYAPNLVMVLFPEPEADLRKPVAWKLRSTPFQLNSRDPLAPFKTCNKLIQVLARAEAESQGADEALLTNETGQAVETSSANLFWIEKKTVCTPPPHSGILPGITREWVFQICAMNGTQLSEKSIVPADLFKSEGVFASLSSLGLVEITHLNGKALPRSEIFKQLRDTYWAALERETA